MAVEIKVPPFPESVQQGVLSAWRKRPGERVARGEKIADIETDKIVLDVTAPDAGVIAKVLVKEGSEVKAGAVIGHLDPGGAPAEPAPTADAKPATPPKPAAPKPDAPPRREPQPATPPPVATQPPPSAAAHADLPTAEDDASSAPASSAPDFDLSPAVRHLVRKHNLIPSEIAGHGRGGRITKTDVLRHLEHSPHLARAFGADTIEPGNVPAPPAPPPPAPADKPVTRIRMTPLRAKIAKRLVEAQQTAAMLTTFNEVNMAAVMALRAKYKEAFEKEHGVKLGFMAFFVKAVVEALARYPVVNASVEADEIVYHGYFDIGVAVSTQRGLVVPVIRDAEQLSISEIEAAIADAAARAQEGKLGLDEITGGTFTISNGGVFGSLMSTPILNPPQSAILGMHRIQERPVAENGQVVIRPMMYLALSYDHRIIDGREAVSFLVAVKELIEDPTRLLLHV